MPTVPMLSPDGIAGDIPQERVPDAVKSGFKMGTELMAPNGQAGIVPMDRVHDAINSGFTLKGAAIPKPASELDPGMTQTRRGPMPYRQAVAAGPNQPAGQAEQAMGFGQTAADDLENFGMAAGATAGGVVGAPAAAAALPAALSFLGRGAKSTLPYIKLGAKGGVAYAATNAVVQGAKKLPVVGDYVSKMPGVDNIPFLVSLLSQGGKPTAEPPAEPGPPLGPETPSPELMQSRSLANPGAAPPPEPSAGLGRLPFIPKPTKLPAAFEPAPAPYRSPTGTADNPASSLSPSRPQLPFLPKPTVNTIGSKVESALGGKPLAQNVPLRQQMPATQAPADLAEGHTPINSSAIRSYKYDPEAQEFHAQATSGDTTYVYGGVSPEEAQAFADNESKGKAWQAIRANPLVAKIINGKRIAVKPEAPSHSWQAEHGRL